MSALQKEVMDASVARIGAEIRDEMDMATFTRRMTRRLKDSGQTIEGLFGAFDADGSGTIEMDEFQQGMVSV